MNIAECIYQLETLKEHCGFFVDEDDPDCVWTADVEALNKAIKIMKYWRSLKVNEKAKEVWEIAERNRLSTLLEYNCDDLDGFADSLENLDEETVVEAILRGCAY